MRERLLPIFESYSRQEQSLIPILEKVQEELGYLSEEAIAEIAHFLKMSASEIYGVASFYALFRFERQGKHTVRVCQGTACHVRGGRRILATVEQALGIHPGETTEDYEFTLERVACFGACALAPVTVIDKLVYGKMTTANVKKLLAGYRGE